MRNLILILFLLAPLIIYSQESGTGSGTLFGGDFEIEYPNDLGTAYDSISYAVSWIVDDHSRKLDEIRSLEARIKQLEEWCKGRPYKPQTVKFYLDQVPRSPNVRYPQRFKLGDNDRYRKVYLLTFDEETNDLLKITYSAWDTKSDRNSRVTKENILVHFSMWAYSGTPYQWAKNPFIY